jgi:hypothetical protein
MLHIAIALTCLTFGFSAGVVFERETYDGWEWPLFAVTVATIFSWGWVFCNWLR